MDKEHYKDFYFIYVLTGANYIRPLIKYFPNIPNKANVVVLTNTPKTLNDARPTNFNLIVDDLDKYRNEWSIENEKIINIEDEQAYMDEYRRLYYEESYRYPMAIMRFGMNWAIQNNIKKFIIVDIGCKIDWRGEEQAVKTAFERIYKLYEERNVMFGHTWFGVHDSFGDHLKLNQWAVNTIKKYIPEYNPKSYPEYIISSIYEYDEKQEKIVEIINDKEPGCAFDGYCIGFCFHNIDVLKVAFNFWCDFVQKSYEDKIIDPNQKDAAVVRFEFGLEFIASLLSKYYNTIISPHHSIVRHFYHPENDWIINKITHIKFQPTKTREEFLKVNKEKIEAVNGIHIAKIIVDGFDNK